MTPRALLRIVPLLALVAITTFVSPAPAEAQLRRVLDLNRQAMDAYTNLEVEEAMDLLQQALQNAQNRGVTGLPLANTYANLGIVSVGGFGDNASGLQHFMSALREEPNVELDPLNSTPDIAQVFRLARNRVGANDGGNNNNNDGGGGGITHVEHNEPGQIPHTPVAEQLTNTAVPIFVEVPTDAPVSGITAHYKAPGMRTYRSVEMRRMAGGFGLELPCTEVMVPRVEYYLEAFDDSGEPMGIAGTSDEPFTVEIVSMRTRPAPSLPGQPAPEQCVDTECPPGMECGSSTAGRAGLGATCVDTEECREGLTCSDNFCIASEHEREPGDAEGTADNGDMPRFFVDIGFTLGSGFASKGRRADDSAGTGNAYVEPGVGDCPESGDQRLPCVSLNQEGMLVTFAARFTVGYWIIPQLAVAATLRFQPNSGTGTLANMLLGLRLMYQLTEPAGTGLNANVFLGGSWGQIQLQPEQNGGEEPFMVAGLGGIQVGANVGYRFHRNMGVTFTPEVHILFPQFLFNMDFTASLSFGF